MQKTCVCGQTFETRIGVQVYCSRSCGQRNRLKPSRVCACGASFVAGSNRAKWCQDCAPRKVEGKRPTGGGEQFACEACGELRRRRPDSGTRFCDKTCHSLWLANQPRANASLVPLGVSGPSWRAAGRHARGRGVWVCGRCAWCESSFLTKYAGTVYCTSRCMEAAKAERRGKFSIRPQVRLAIYKRDGWVCQLCFGPVQPGLPPSDSWAATLDHIECVSWTLIPDHSPANLRLAHRWCNSVRGDERGYTAADLAA